jgi:hypothetical protein
MIISNNRRIQKEEEEGDSFYFHDRCKEIRLMLNDCLIYPKHLKGDETLLRKFKILNHALANFEDICNNMISKSSHNNNK